jgi:hypothetical protein
MCPPLVLGKMIRSVHCCMYKWRWAVQIRHEELVMATLQITITMIMVIQHQKLSKFEYWYVIYDLIKAKLLKSFLQRNKRD